VGGNDRPQSTRTTPNAAAYTTLITLADALAEAATRFARKIPTNA
jgi:hypothetical protein